VTFVVDTPALAALLFGAEQQLGSDARRILQGGGPFLVPGHALVELRLLARRHHVPLPWSEVERIFDGLEDTTVVPLDPEVVRRMPPQLDLHDALLAAAAQAHSELQAEDVILVTPSQSLKEWGGLRVLW